MPTQETQDGPFGGLDIVAWKLIDRGALRGVADVELPSGIVLHGCSLFKKDARYWVTPPQQSYLVGGVTRYKPCVSFTTRATSDAFSGAVVKALRELPEAQQEFQEAAGVSK